MTQPTDCPPFLGRVLSSTGTPVGSCFQVSPRVLVTAWHVLENIGKSQIGSSLEVDPLVGGPSSPASVHAVDELRDLAVLLSENALPDSVQGLTASSSVKPLTTVVISGVARLVGSAPLRYGTATGTWQGPVMRYDKVALARVESLGVMQGMSGTPVRRLDDDQVIGVVCARYNSGDEWFRNTVWIARTEDIVPLLAGISPVMVASPAIAEMDRSNEPPTRRAREGLRDIADALAHVMHRQWEAEAVSRRLYDPYAMAIPLRPASQELFTAWPVLVRSAWQGTGWPDRYSSGMAASPEQLVGNERRLIDVLNRIPTGRLVVLGEPGAGKTILLVQLLLDFLARRQDGELVPVLLPLASWNPSTDSLYAWVESSLINENPGLAAGAPGATDGSRARALLEAGLLLLLLDGLDELPETARALAIARVNESTRPGHRVVLTSRTSAYESAVRPAEAGEAQMSGAAGVEVAPLNHEVVRDYLMDSAGGPIAASRWNQVFVRVVADPACPAGLALRTPLMAALARAVYNVRPGEEGWASSHDPEELLDTLRFPTARTVASYLFDRFIPAAYQAQAGQKNGHGWTAAQAERWLIFLARGLERRQIGGTEIAWWRLPDSSPSALVAGVVGLIAGLIAAFGYSPNARNAFAVNFGIGILISLAAGLLFLRLRGWHGESSIGRGLAAGLAGGLVGGIVSLSAFGLGADGVHVGEFLGGGLALGAGVAALRSVPAAFLGALIGEVLADAISYGAVFHGLGERTGFAATISSGLGVGLAAGFAANVASKSSASGSPARGLRWSPIGLILGVTCGLLVGYITWAQSGLAAGLVVGVAGTIGGTLTGLLFGAVTTDLAEAITPRRAHERDRSAFLLSWLGMGVPYGLATGLATAYGRNAATGLRDGTLFGAGVGVTSFFVVGLVFALFQACWGSYALAHCWLAVRGRLPWRLMAFLDDAHRNRGVLRQVGVVYQFRHLELQRRLTSAEHPLDSGMPSTEPETDRVAP